jgi:hypothetical protein
MTSDLQSRIAKAFRVRGPRVRRIYFNARRARRFLRDAPRRSVLATLAPTDVDIAPQDGFVVVPPGRFPETDAIVGEARAALARYDATSPPSRKEPQALLAERPRFVIADSRFGDRSLCASAGTCCPLCRDIWARSRC